MLVHEMVSTLGMSSQPRSKEYLEFCEEERSRDEAVLRKQTQATFGSGQKMYSAHMREMAACWSRPLHIINAAAQNPVTAKGLYFNVLLRPEGYVEEPQTKEEMISALAKFMEELPAKTGFNLSPLAGGPRRFEAFAITQHILGHHRIDADTCSVFFAAMKDWEAFPANELAYNDAWIAGKTSPEHVPSIADLEQVNLMTDEGATLGRRIAQELYIREAHPIVQRWVDSLVTRFNFVIIEAQMKEVMKYLESHNLSYLDLSALERARVALTRRGTLPSRCLTLDELRAIIIEKTDDRESLRIALHGNAEAIKAIMAQKNISIY